MSKIGTLSLFSILVLKQRFLRGQLGNDKYNGVLLLRLLVHRRVSDTRSLRN